MIVIVEIFHNVLVDGDDLRSTAAVIPCAHPPSPAPAAATPLVKTVPAHQNHGPASR